MKLGIFRYPRLAPPYGEEQRCTMTKSAQLFYRFLRLLPLPRLLALALPIALGCQSGSPSDSADAGAGPPSAVPGLSLMTELSGLWAGPATTTPLGPIPIMNMDLRAASGSHLFGRVDLDGDNNLRFDLSIEAPAEAPAQSPVLIFRNGGYFLGILRDSRTQLVEYKKEGPSYRFCGLKLGCDYLDARFTFSDASHLTLDVKVRGQQHILWTPERKETRELPTPFPPDQRPQGTGDAPFPTLPRLLATVSWDKPLPNEADVLMILSTTACSYLTPANLGCTVSRSLFGHAPVGATSVSLTFDQIHAGSYKATAILDRHGTLKQRLFPQSGDGLTLPNQGVVIAASGDSTAAVPILLTIP